MYRVKLLLDFLRGKSPSQILVKVIKGASEGKFGPKAQKVYSSLEGLKTWTGAVVVAVTFALETLAGAGLCADCDAYATTAYTVGAFLLSVGLLDGAVRAEAPKKPLTPYRR